MSFSIQAMQELNRITPEHCRGCDTAAETIKHLATQVYAGEISLGQAREDFIADIPEYCSSRIVRPAGWGQTKASCGYQTVTIRS